MYAYSLLNQVSFKCCILICSVYMAASVCTQLPVNKLLSVLLETDIKGYYCCYAVLLANAYSAVCDVNVGEAKDSILVF